MFFGNPQQFSPQIRRQNLKKKPSSHHLDIGSEVSLERFCTHPSRCWSILLPPRTAAFFWQQLFFGPIGPHGMKIGILRLGTELADPMELDDSDASVAELRRSVRERLEVDEKMGVRLGVSVYSFLGVFGEKIEGTAWLFLLWIGRKHEKKKIMRGWFG